MGGNMGGNVGDIYINYKDIHKDNPERDPGNPEEDMNDDHNRRGAAPDNLNRLYPPRTRPLNEDERRIYYGINDLLSDCEEVCEMYDFNGRRMIRAIVRSDAFPLDLVEYAIQKTVSRNRNYPLNSAAAYTVTLLNDWRDQGFEKREDVQEAKADYWHYN